ncbi:MAG: Asp/Glu/hydantoin racemase [Rhizobiales bacterium 32-66-8]|nr:MAG: Asp/Glu/hydantoin racemase [Rhizobiales bacterium 32-66-8]
MAADRDEHFYEPKAGHGLPHDPFNALVGPRPIGWISSRAADGTLNLAPYSFFNAFNYTPPIIGFSSTTPKDSLANIAATGEFCWNLATRDLAQAMNASSATVGPEVDEFVLAGVTPVESRLVTVPRVAESPVTFECRLSQIIPLTAADGTPTEARLVLGEVVGVHIDRALLKDGTYQTAAAYPILRAGGPGGYAQISPEIMFEMFRPRG